MLTSKSDSLIPISQLAFNLGIKPKTKEFDINSYIPITLIPANQLFADKEFQRLVIASFIKGAKEFDGP